MVRKTVLSEMFVTAKKKRDKKKGTSQTDTRLVLDMNAFHEKWGKGGGGPPFHELQNPSPLLGKREIGVVLLKKATNPAANQMCGFGFVF